MYRAAKHPDQLADDAADLREEGSVARHRSEQGHLLRVDVCPNPLRVGREETGVGTFTRLGGELAEQLLDLYRRQHGVAVAEVRRVARGANAHERSRRQD